MQMSSFKRHCSPRYIERFATYIRDWKGKAEAAARELFHWGNELGRNLLREGGWLQAAQGYSCHLLLRGNQQEQFQLQMKHPPHGTLLVHFDMEEPLSCCDALNRPTPVRWRKP